MLLNDTVWFSHVIRVNNDIFYYYYNNNTIVYRDIFHQHILLVRITVKISMVKISCELLCQFSDVFQFEKKVFGISKCKSRNISSEKWHTVYSNVPFMKTCKLFDNFEILVSKKQKNENWNYGSRNSGLRPHCVLAGNFFCRILKFLLNF